MKKLTDEEWRALIGVVPHQKLKDFVSSKYADDALRTAKSIKENLPFQSKFGEIKNLLSTHRNAWDSDSRSYSGYVRADKEEDLGPMLEGLVHLYQAHRDSNRIRNRDYAVGIGGTFIGAIIGYLLAKFG